MKKVAQIRRHFHCIALALFILLMGAPTTESFSATTKQPTTTTVPPPTTNSVKDEELRNYQKQVSGPVANSFEPSTFHPFPLLSNKHVQTIVATFLRDIPQVNYLYSIPHSLGCIVSSLYNKSNNKNNNNDSFWDSRERFDTPDDDFFDVDYKYSSTKESTAGWVVMCHGLESNSHSNLSMDMALAYHKQGLNVACLNFRGCSGTNCWQLGGYHLGFTNDLLQFLDELTSRNNNNNNNNNATSPIYLSGFSLGANVILKALGELNMQAISEYNIQGATAFCVPYCAQRNAPFLASPGFNQMVYCGKLLQTLKQRANDQLEEHCNGDKDTEKFDYPGVVQAKTITDFDDAFVAQVYGFDSAIDYYQQTSCLSFLPNIAVPTFILTAKDDPFMDPTHFPTEVSLEGGGPAPLKMVRMTHGGHCGFVFHKVQDKEDILETSWSSTEMARFLQHVEVKRGEMNPQNE